MRTVMICMCAFLLGATLPAQQADSIQSPAENGGFVCMLASPTRLNGAAGLLIGGGLYGVFEHRVRVGLVGAGLVNDVPGRGATAASRRNLTFGYGGVYGEYVIDPTTPIQFSLYTMAGAGGLLYNGTIPEPRVGAAKTSSIDVELDIDRATDAFLIAEPGMSVEASLAENLHISAGAGYRFVHGVETDGVSNATISGPVATLMLRFGVF